MSPPPEAAGPGPEESHRPAARGWWGGNADRGDSVRLEAFSDGVLAIAITLLILDIRVEQQPGQSLAAALGHAAPEVVAYAASFLQIGIMWPTTTHCSASSRGSTSCCSWPTCCCSAS